VTPKEVTMMNCTFFVTRDMLKDPIDIRVDDRSLDFSGARQLADGRARERSYDPMLIAWFDRKAGRYSPGDVVCCDRDMPTWLTYARAHGADVFVDINNEDFVFAYKG
jgi:hypothetical protein